VTRAASQGETGVELRSPCGQLPCSLAARTRPPGRATGWTNSFDGVSRRGWYLPPAIVPAAVLVAYVRRPAWLTAGLVNALLFGVLVIAVFSTGRWALYRNVGGVGLF